MRKEDVKSLEERITRLEDRVIELTDIVFLLIDANKDNYRLYEYMETISDAVSHLLNLTTRERK